MLSGRMGPSGTGQTGDCLPLVPGGKYGRQESSQGRANRRNPGNGSDRRRPIRRQTELPWAGHTGDHPSFITFLPASLFPAQPHVSPIIPQTSSFIPLYVMPLTSLFCSLSLISPPVSYLIFPVLSPRSTRGITGHCRCVRSTEGQMGRTCRLPPAPPSPA